MRENTPANTNRAAVALLFCFGAAPLMAADPEPSMPTSVQAVTLIKTPPEILTRQKLPNVVGISAETAGSKSLSMNLVIIPPDVPHQPINLSETEAARAIVVRNDPNEQEHVILYNPSDDD